ncbi:MAG: hypothetical protein HC837_14795 [Chloroflexaceae bacterium]|nr:hypothetical protein [Chloroflexaceae bacterium]
MVSYYAMMLILPRRADMPSRLSLWLQAGGAALLTLLLLAAIFFSQSRGPWLGLGVGLFVFISLLLWRSQSHAKVHNAFKLKRGLQIAFGVWMLVAVAGIAFIIAFNVSDDPMFKPLRNMPYIGRLGSLLDATEGTGRVRYLIWNGDEYAGGARELIVADPLHTVVGWGPESMFVAFNPFYPPTLVEVESRGASPDRSHNAFLDEIVTKGVLGLISYLFLIFSYAALSWRLMRHSHEWPWQVFFIACFSAVIGHIFEGVTGIPIVATLTMLWVTMAMTVVGGMLTGHALLPSPLLGERGRG